MGTSARRLSWVLILASVLAAPAWAKDDAPARFQGFDVITLRGATVKLQAKLEGPGLFHPDLEDVEVGFRIRGEKKAIGTAKTADEGTASLMWSPPKDAKTDIFEIEAFLPAGSKVHAPPALLRVFVWTSDRPVLVVDIDGTIALGSAGAILSGDIDKIPPRAGAVSALQHLAKHYAICYLTARDDSLLASSRAWLDAKHFPKGPVLVRDINLFHLSAQRYKERCLKNLKKLFHLVAGVGDREDDADAYLAAGMDAYLIGSTERVPEGARKLVSWSEIEKLLSS